VGALEAGTDSSAKIFQSSDGFKVLWINACTVSAQVINDVISCQEPLTNAFKGEPMNFLILTLKICGCITAAGPRAIPDPALGRWLNFHMPPKSLPEGSSSFALKASVNKLSEIARLAEAGCINRR
jgi:hypothetical protein